MSRKLVLGLLAGALSVGGIVVAIQLSKPPLGTPTAKTLLAEWEKLNSSCRGGSGDDPYTNQACAERDGIDRQLAAQGWCYGEGAQFQYQMSWQPCGTSSGNASGPVNKPSPNSDAVNFDERAAMRTERLELLYAETEGCMFKMARLRLKLGDRSRADLIAKMAGVCGRTYEGTRRAYGYVQAKPEMDAYLWNVANRQLDAALRIASP